MDKRIKKYKNEGKWQQTVIQFNEHLIRRKKEWGKSSTGIHNS